MHAGFKGSSGLWTAPPGLSTDLTVLAAMGGLLLCLLGQEQATKTKNNIRLNSCVLRMILGLCSWESGLNECMFVCFAHLTLCRTER